MPLVGWKGLHQSLYPKVDWHRGCRLLRYASVIKNRSASQPYMIVRKSTVISIIIKGCTTTYLCHCAVVISRGFIAIFIVVIIIITYVVMRLCSSRYITCFMLTSVMVSLKTSKGMPKTCCWFSHVVRRFYTLLFRDFGRKIIGHLQSYHTCSF